MAGYVTGGEGGMTGGSGSGDGRDRDAAGPFPLDSPPPLPGRAQLAALCAAAFVPLAALGALAAAGWNAPAAPLLAAPVVVALTGPLVRRAGVRRTLADSRYVTLSGHPAARQLGSALAPAGVRQVVLRAGAVDGITRNFRSGHVGVILVHERALTRHELAGFFLAHEAAHLARYDGLRRPIVITSAVACWASLTVAWPPAGILVLPLIAAVAMFNHAMELHCDRLAARWAGPRPAALAMSVLAAGQPTPMTPVKKARRLLTYPAPARRAAAISALAPPAPDGDEPPARPARGSSKRRPIR